MGSDMLVALGSASVQGLTLFGLNHHAAGRPHHLRLAASCHHAPDATILLGERDLPQARQTCTVLGWQPAGTWGFTHGVNEHRVAVGVATWNSRLPRQQTGLTGAELTRLALERSHSSMQAVEVLTDLLTRHGQRPDPDGGDADHVFLIADPAEAFVLEAAGRWWALLECWQTRAVTDVALIRQDWRRLSPGLAEHAIAQDWWHNDGSKVDFAGSLDGRAPTHAPARRRWGRASVALAQQAGAIDAHFLRRLLADHAENNFELLPAGAEPTGSFLAELAADDRLPLAWCSFGSPQAALWFPVPLQGELPAAFGPGHPENPALAVRLAQLLQHAEERDADPLCEALERLQGTFDREAEQYQDRAGPLLRQGNVQLVAALATTLMQRHVELFEKEWRQLSGIPEVNRYTRDHVEESSTYMY